MKLIATVYLLCLSLFVFGQPKLTEKQYYSDLDTLDNQFYGFLVPHLSDINSLSQSKFLKKIDSLKAPYDRLVNKYEKELGPTFAEIQETDLGFKFDRFLYLYPYFHQQYTNTAFKFPEDLVARLRKTNLKINNPGYLKLPGYNDYIDALVHDEYNKALKSGVLKNSDNKKLDAVFNVLPQYFTNKKCLDYWEFTYLKYHIENLGIKGIEKVYKKFIAVCRDTSYANQITASYNADLKGRTGHIIETYKTVDGFSLDIHLFLPDSNKFPSNHKPAIVYFHGGSWTEGKPDWFFPICKYDADHGWVSAAVEYRIGDRFGSLPFESVKDAKSAIRWLRANAGKYKFDKNKIVASGNSAGGHLVLCTALIDGYNESTDNLAISPKPDVLMLNSGVFDLTIKDGWISAGLGNPDTVKAISPINHIKKITQPLLMIHGTADNNVPYWTAEKFAKEMKDAGNSIEFKTLDGSGHFLWYDSRFSDVVNKTRGAFLEANGIK